MKTFFTSDTHFGHANILKYSKRPFANVQEMDEKFIENWNKVVTPKDRVFHLGDFLFGDIRRARELIRRLNGTICFIWGNHDKTMSELQYAMSRDCSGSCGSHGDIKGKIQFWGDMPQVEVEGQQIVLCHYAMRVWNKSHHGTWHLYGHSHGSLPDDPNSLSFDVGVDCHHYHPISFQQVDDIMSKKVYVPIDHHGERKAGGGSGLSKDEYAKVVRKQQYEMLKKEFNEEK